MLNKFIKNEAKKLFPDLLELSELFHQHEMWESSVNSDVLDGSWVESKTTHIYKVGTYIVSDDNKLDWVFAFYGYQRRKDGDYVFLGYRHFPRSEKDYMAKIFQRIIRHAPPTIER